MTITAQGMAARQGRDAVAARREAQQPGPEGMHLGVGALRDVLGELDEMRRK